MTIVKEKAVVTQRIHGDCPTHSRTEIPTRHVRSVLDEPRERAGPNMGPTPHDTLITPLNPRPTRTRPPLAPYPNPRRAATNRASPSASTFPGR